MAPFGDSIVSPCCESLTAFCSSHAKGRKLALNDSQAQLIREVATFG